MPDLVTQEGGEGCLLGTADEVGTGSPSTLHTDTPAEHNTANILTHDTVLDHLPKLMFDCFDGGFEFLDPNERNDCFV